MTSSPQALLNRLALVLVALGYLGAWGGDAAGLGSCPHHLGSIPGMEAEHTPESHAHGAEEDEEHDHGPCVCIGDCVGAASDISRVAGSFQPLAPPPQENQPFHTRGDERLHRIHTPFVLPYSTAPPSGLVRTHT